jgi:hypothetical protein
MDARIRIRIHSKMSWIRNIGKKERVEKSEEMGGALVRRGGGIIKPPQNSDTGRNGLAADYHLLSYLADISHGEKILHTIARKRPPKAGVLKKLSLAGLAKLSRLRYS